MSSNQSSRTWRVLPSSGCPVPRLVLRVFLATAVAATMPAAPAVSAVPSPAAADSSAAGSARCAVPDKPGRFKDGTGSTTVTVTDVSADCLRTYRLVSSVAGERVFKEAPDKPTLRSGSALLDGLYAMAHDDAELNKTDQLTDGSYNDGKPVDCPGGCYQTGKEWPYVWTRDVSYSADLGLTTTDPERMRNTLDFKLSERRDGSGDTQIIQDTGTGGSYPSSTDRVVWALGASEIINWLPDGKRQAFAAKSYEAIRNTIEHDRKVVFDQGDGLYLGEHSFLDWREQSYADWTMDDVATIATSRSLSTNVTHWAAIDVASRLAADAGDKSAAARYRGWADDLMRAIREKFWLPEKGQFSQMLTTEKDTSAVNRYDALGTSLAVLTGIATPEQAKEAIANYPQTVYGPSVLWPQQQGVPSYHNNAVWPFVTAYMMRAAAQAGDDGVATQQARSLVRGAALYGTNKENINILDGSTSTEINSDRQLWSVAGMMSMVQQSIFGVDASADGLHIKPFLPARLRDSYFPGGERAVLSGLDYRGHKLNVELDIPAGKTTGGAYRVQSLALDGKTIPAGRPITEKMLGDGESSVVVKLTEPAPGAGRKAPRPVDVSSKEALYGPTTPEVTKVTAKDGRTRLSFDIGDENPSQVAMDVLRDSKVIAENVPVTTGAQTWTDKSSRPGEISHCYSVRLSFTSSGNTSQHAKPMCYWGPDAKRIQKVTAGAFDVTGGKRTSDGNGVYYEDWGTAPGDKLAARLTAKATGEYLLQVDAAVGGPLNTGVSSGMKMLSVYDDATGDLVTKQVIAMPRTGSWSTVRGSTFAKTKLAEGRTYRIELAQDPLAVNMSYFQHNASYKDTLSGPANYSNVYAIQALLKE
ncbi:MGH1-like glycoside hydrolase domain-containing protein [Streptomyces sp. NPDC050658]|uniref:MGH1-like glycoside hydrolase domain-containing protein n=1 Tax=unclassified Streptomyces TaxID=2593676 RepID=UPI0034327DB1